jgi:hypothetical protein
VCTLELLDAVLSVIGDYDINGKKPVAEVQNYSPLTALQRLSDAKTSIETKHGKDCWATFDQGGIDANGENWVTILRDKLSKHMNRRCMNEGQSLSLHLLHHIVCICSISPHLPPQFSPSICPSHSHFIPLASSPSLFFNYRSTPPLMLIFRLISFLSSSLKCSVHLDCRNSDAKKVVAMLFY